MEQTKRWYNDKDRLYIGLARSLWVTSATDWFMSFAGKSVEIVLYATVLYSCAQLYPGVHLPESLSLAVFLIQMGALDIGGLALGKLARQTHEDGNEQGAKHARRLSIGLIAIMLIGVATVGIERVIPLSSEVQTGVQLVLVIARSVGSVLYGRVVHDLKPVENQPALRQEELSQTLSEQFSRLLSTAIEQLRQELSSGIAEVSQEFSCQLSELQQALAQQGNQVQGNLTTLHQASETHDRMLSALNGLPATLERYEQATHKALAEMRANLESSSAGRSRLSLVSSVVQPETFSGELSEISGKAFIEAYVTTHPEVRNAGIIEEAAKLGLSLSQSYVSQIRKALKEQSA